MAEISPPHLVFWDSIGFQNTRCGGSISAIRHIEMTLYEKRETVDACDQTGEPSCQNFVFYCEMKCVKFFIKSCSSLEHGNPSFDKLLKTVMSRYFRSPWTDHIF